MGLRCGASIWMFVALSMVLFLSIECQGQTCYSYCVCTTMCVTVWIFTHCQCHKLANAKYIKNTYVKLWIKVTNIYLNNTVILILHFINNSIQQWFKYKLTRFGYHFFQNKKCYQRLMTHNKCTVCKQSDAKCKRASSLTTEFTMSFNYKMWYSNTMLLFIYQDVL